MAFNEINKYVLFKKAMNLGITFNYKDISLGDINTFTIISNELGKK